MRKKIAENMILTHKRTRKPVTITDADTHICAQKNTVLMNM
jgi:hypothetical protein